MQKNLPFILLIASLPALPDYDKSHDLVLQYSLERKQGIFLYNSQPLQMTCFIEKIQKSTGSRNYEKKSLTEQVDQTEIPCDWLHAWLSFAFHDTYYDTIEITLTVDLVQLRGEYIERDQRETVD